MRRSAVRELLKVGKNTLRLNFSNASPERIEQGIQRLGRLSSGRIKQAT
jgi:DNA-binding transcriptional MocR family regulator